MKTTYLGLELSSPIIVSSSPYTSTVSNIEQCAKNGAGAVVLKSIFEEQITHEIGAMGHHSEDIYGDADVYLHRYMGEDYKARFISLIKEASAKVDIPIIASINCVGQSDLWIEFAQSMAEAGAAAIELNVFVQPTDIHEKAQEIEQHYAGIVGKVAKAVKVPVSVKLPMRLTNVYNMADTLLGYGAKGVVLFNRFFEPDVNIEKISYVESQPYSQPSELRNILRTAAIFNAVLPKMDLAVSTGVHDGAAAVKALLCGANAVQVCSAIQAGGYGVIARMNEFLDDWAERHGYKEMDDFRGKLNFSEDASSMCQRSQYMRYFPNKD